jgi:hypothetical protein
MSISLSDMFCSVRSVVLAVVVAVTTQQSQAYATTILENATYYESFTLYSSYPPDGTTGLGGYYHEDPGTVYHYSSNGINESATANPPRNAVGATTAISAPAQLNPEAPYMDYISSGAAQAALSYYLEVIGPDGLVPVTIRAAGEASALPDVPGYGSSSAYAEFALSGPGVGISADACVDETDLSCTYSYFTVNGIYQFTANTIYDVSLVATAEGYAYATGPGSLAGADVDPAFIAPPGYSVVLSPGVGNPILGVPEPSTWTLLLVGFVGVGAARYAWRRERKSSSVA